MHRACLQHGLPKLPFRKPFRGQVLHGLRHRPAYKTISWKKSEGNPFFVEEVVRTLIDDSLIVRDESGTQWLATGRGEAFNIPSNVQALLTARIDRLEEETRS